jgi:hypothetical protein
MTRNTERYGIFQKLPDGSPLWIGAESDLERAMQTVRDLAKTDGLEYFLHDFDRGVSIPIVPPRSDAPPIE